MGFWRAMGHSHNAFFSGSFVDEIAFELKQDPVALRRQRLTQAPRYLVVLELAASRAGWGSPLPPGRARGIALHESFGSVVSQVSEVSATDGQLQLHRVVCAIDSGSVVNPGVLAQQMEGAVLFTLSAAPYGQIDIHKGVVQQKNFTSYPMLRLAQSPQVNTCIVSSTRHPNSVGEPGVPPLAPTVANALFALNGTRVRSLPLQQ